MLMDLAISSEFEMRYRGLLEYYGKDFIAYKKEKPSDKIRNEFLRVISKYMTHYLEDDCPPSWKQCQQPFWEDLIYSFYPDHIKISPEEKDVDTFLYELKKFVRWLDKRVGTSWYKAVEQYTLEAFPDLKICERIINRLTLNDFPRIHHKDWNLEQDLDRFEENFNQCTERADGIFKVTTIIGNTVVVSEMNSNCTYYIKGLPTELIMPGIKMNGTIGKKSGEVAWGWYLTTSIYPPRGRKLDYPFSIMHEALTTLDGVHFSKK
ncbi:hypothetical protein AM1BK_34520 [Neobacillus kokaensis]|uniref:Uncharacterized protein n=2 Tax=Neobacillus kokaensis TaxID=2759023 RepID=A0ABQ3N5G2_9BACI|nr:hypothetical protein AM1BK_34520 [Neobacillus kokaensis]